MGKRLGDLGTLRVDLTLSPSPYCKSGQAKGEGEDGAKIVDKTFFIFFLGEWWK